MSLPRTLVLIPTYNEAESLARLLDRLFAANPAVDALVIDDASPDGTGDIADEIAANDSRVRVLHRTAKDGLGAAYLAGFAQGMAEGYELLVELDADGSHPPERLPVLLERALDADLVIGSRWVPGGEIVGWSRVREAISRGGNLFARAMLGIRIGDMTAGYRVYRTTLLRDIELDAIASAGYCFQIDMTLRSVAAGARIVEVPITFRERAHGSSKMTNDIVAEAFVNVAGWGVGRRAADVRRLFDAALRRTRSLP